MAHVFLFPGQSSADPQALARARRAHPAADAVADAAVTVLGRTEADAYLAGPSARLAGNRDVQLVVFLASQMYLRALEAEGVRASASLGLSLGEYSHLVHIGAISFEDALALVSERGHCYDRAPQGVMVTVLGADRDTVEAAVAASAPSDGTVVVSNYNAPTQHVIAGHDAAVTRVAGALEDAGAHTILIEPHVPMHSPLMVGVALQFGRTLATAGWRRPAMAYRPNVTGRAIDPVHADAPMFVDLLTRHVSEPVRWDASLDLVATTHADATFVEVGPGGVLHNLVGRGWRRLARHRVDAPDGRDPAMHLRSTLEALSARA
ncbi:MAG: ACP S-malonyltransferase [Vicinamibacterales bacterium]